MGAMAFGFIAGEICTRIALSQGRGREVATGSDLNGTICAF